MSDENMEIEPCVEPSNVCTSVDVFDKFQNGLMYEESEFITLSDILPPQPEVPVLSNEIDDLDSVDVYTGFQNESVKEIRSQQQDDHLVNTPESVPQVSSTNPPELGKNKRGRKSRKTFVDDTPSLLVSETPKPSSNGKELETNVPTDSNQNGRSKRQRKPKYVFDEECLAENIGRRKRRKTSNNDAKPTSLKRRGRPKKSNILETIPTTESAVDSTEQLTEPTVELTPSKKKRNTKKTLPPSQINEEIDSPLSKRRGRTKTVEKTEVNTNGPNEDDTSLLAEQTDEQQQETQNPTEKELTDNDFTELGEFDLDDLSLSQLKESLDLNIEMPTQENVETLPNKTEPQLENNVGEQYNFLEETKSSEETNLTQGKPKRSRVKATAYDYGSESEEDPFANVELSDDEPRSKKKGTKYYSDDEYVPGIKSSPEISSDSASEIEDQEEEERGRRKRSKVFKSPKKGCRGKSKDYNKGSPTVTTLMPSAETDDIEGQLQSSVILATDTAPDVIPGKWGTTSEFESFLKKKITGTDLKIKKFHSSQCMESVKPPLEIPTIDPTEAKKYVENSSQTEMIVAEKSVQTSPNELVMVENVRLSNSQKAEACHFLESIVKTTAELGQLMTAKSEEFIKKKINVLNVTDTFKMDYCVKKSYLLFKLAKHNLMQMEEDLEKNYHEFLRQNNLSQYREQPKIVAPKPKESNSDSDCEIVEDKPGKSGKTNFNPKTVFLNKELSIKITKKPSEEKNIKPNMKNIKGLKHTVWISDSVMVKKVKSTQSFLAQDSRTKKPPDSVLQDIVENFFSDFNRRKAAALCAPYVTRDWLTVKQDQLCHYFFINPDNVKVSLPTSEPYEDFNTNNTSSNQMNSNGFQLDHEVEKTSPKTLFTLCTQILQNYTCSSYTTNKVELPINDYKKSPRPLFKLCTENLQRQMRTIQNINNNTTKITDMNKEKLYTPDTLFVTSLNVLNTQGLTLNPVWSLKSICLHRVRSLYLNVPSSMESIVSDTELSSSNDCLCDIEMKKNHEEELNSSRDLEFLNGNMEQNYESVFTLKALCLQKVRSLYFNVTSSIESVVGGTNLSSTKNLNCLSHFNEKNDDGKDMSLKSDLNLTNGNTEQSYEPIFSLKCICLQKIRSLTMHVTPSIESIGEAKLSTKNNFDYSTKNEKEFKLVLTLKSICLQRIKSSMMLATSSIESIANTELSSINNFDCSSNDDLETKNEEELLNGSECDLTDFNPVLTLKAISLQKVRSLFQSITTTNVSLEGDMALSVTNDFDWSTDNDDEENDEMELVDKPIVKSLFTLSVEVLQNILKSNNSHAQHKALKFTPSTLKQISLENIVNVFYPNIEDVLVTESIFDQRIDDNVSRSPTQNLKIISMKTEPGNEGSQFSDDNSYATEDYEPDYDNLNDQPENEETETKWMPQVQIHESEYEIAANNIPEQPNITQIKLEPFEELPRTNEDLQVIKSEPGLDQMTIIPESVTTKQEKIDNNERVPLTRQDSSSYDVETFESFVRNNKMMSCFTDYGDENDFTFTQSGLRIRQQHIPDYDTENDNNLSLLVPQTFEPFNIDVAKGSLMESSCSDNEETSKKNTKKKIERKGRGRPKKTVSKEKELSNDAARNNDKVKTNVSSDILTLTRKMKEKIRCEEKKTESSESDYEDVPLSLRSEKAKQLKGVTKEIQCNNIDSTESCETLKGNNEFIGFSAVDQCGISNYHKYAKFMYAKLLEENAEPEASNKKKNTKQESAIIDRKEQGDDLELELTTVKNDTINTATTSKTSDKIQKLDFVVRDGWNCYSIDKNDKKLYSTTSIPLHKLPQTFVDTYLQYQDLTDIEKEDVEINRLTNLQSLKRIPNSKVNVASKNKRKEIKADGTHSGLSDISRSVSPTFSIPAAELTPSEDEEVDVGNEPLPPVPKRDSENKQAKDLLMADQGSDSDGPLIQLKNVKIEVNSESQPPKRPGPKSKTKPVENLGNLMLTADKMMNKELALLHAPVNLNESLPDIPIKTENTNKVANKRGSKLTRKRESVKNEEDSSSEEEKQWVSTKEKLLKRLVKKPEDTNVEDAKRAKIVSEFIEKRIDKRESRMRTKKGKIRSRKKFLERQKQLRVLSNELYGDQDTAQIGKRSAAYFKGRRNIRKVIDKKSLTKSTVTANMEEFARKQRLITNQMLLREELGCEEDVNVLVINDEVCLEYDFEEHQPVVTVHPFFTKVMKAHQYEGVKFMWDACFESLKMIESGDRGGGCILAHCMGLGKTLQVLALLHTVLTHPRAEIRRVLVCCPLSTVLNWVDEIHKWIGPVTDQIKVFELSKLKKTYERAYQLEDWYNGGGIFIIGYELFRSLSTLDPYLDNVRPTIVNKIRTALLDPGPDIIVCDEGHLLKNDCSVLAVAMSRVATKRRIILTGTPMQNNLREYYCMVNFVKPNLLGTYSEYSNRFENPIMNGQHRDSVEADIKLMKARTHILHKVLEGCLQRQEVSVLYPYLPKKHEYTVFISLTECQWKLYKHYLDHYSKGQKKQGVLKDFHILQKVWTHPQVLHNFLMKPRSLPTSSTKLKPEKIEDDLALEDINAPEDVKDEPAELWWIDYLENGAMLETLESSHKMEAVFKILDECVAVGDKILIFSTSLYSMDTLEYFLKKIKKWNLGTDYYRLDGSVPAEVRQKWCREFNAENNHNTKLFLISTRAGSLGLNLVAANRVIILDTSWNPAHDIQSIFRIYRFGQKKDCYIYRLVALGTMEQKIYERSVTKQAVACRVVDEQQIDRHYNSADLTELYRYDELGTSVVGGVALGVRDVVLLRVARAAAVHAVHEHDSLLRGSTEQALDETEREAVWHQFQQEHHHKQMQTAMPPVSIHMPVKPVKPAAAAEPQPGPSRVAAPAPSDPAPSGPAPPGPRGKGRGRVLQPTHVPVAPSARDATSAPDEYDEGDSIQKNILIGKITNRLLVEDYHTRVGKKISEIVELVRDIVHNNELKKIASDMDTITDALCAAMLTQSPQVPPDAKKKGRGRPRKVSKKRQKTVPKNESEPPPNEIPSNKWNAPPTVTRVGNEADYHDNDDSEATISCPASPIATDTPSKEIEQPAPKPNIPAPKPNIPAPKPNIPAPKANIPAPKANIPAPKANIPAPKANIPAPKPNIPASSNTTIQTPNIDCNEIFLLSDDDEPPQPKVEPEADTSKSTKNPVAKVPLPRALLKNENFIKIVAHKYLSNNSSLDEDAATLAARYSTLKAYKEIESTGKELYCGPLYDIAVEVLGIQVLESLQNHGDKIKIKDTQKILTAKPGPLSKKAQMSVPANNLRVKTQLEVAQKENDNTNNMKQIETTTPKSTLPTVNKRVLTFPKKPQIQTRAATTVEKVVPVGMFSRSNSVNAECSDARESESILPDDDSTSSVQLLRRQGSKPLILNHVIASKENSTTTKPMRTRTIKPMAAARSSPAPAARSAPAPAVRSGPAPAPSRPPPRPEQILSDTICLDSDDEEPRAPPAGPEAPPVPVSLMAANPAALAAIPGVGPSPRLVPVTPQPAPPPGVLLGPNNGLFLIPATNVHRSATSTGAQILHMLPPQYATSGVVSMSHNANPMPPLYLTSGVAPMSLNTNLMQTSIPNVLIDQKLKPLPEDLRAATEIGPTAPSNPQVARQVAPLVAPQVALQVAPQVALQVAPQVREPTLPASHRIKIPSNVPGPTPGPLSKNIAVKPKTKVLKTVCKRGDIFRINEQGQVEILKSLDDIPAPTSIPTNANAPSTINPEPVVVPDTTPPDPPNQKGKYESTRRKRNISSSSSSSDDSRPATPDNPLSILRDVVHIQAAEEPMQTSKLIKTPTPSKATAPRGKVTATPSKATAKPTRAKPTLAAFKSNFIKLKERINMQRNKSNSSLLSKDAGDWILNENKDKLDEKKNKTTNNASNTVAGNSRSILIKSSGKTQQLPFPSVDLTDTPSIQVTNVQKLAPVNKSPSLSKPSSKTIITTKPSGSSKTVETKKRPIANAPEVSAKKQKTKIPMTLQDFNIDDFDDIIELE